MNTLITTVFPPETNASNKASARQTQTESSPSENNGFAGALANQINPPQNNTTTAASTTTGKAAQANSANESNQSQTSNATNKSTTESSVATDKQQASATNQEASLKNTQATVVISSKQELSQAQLASLINQNHKASNAANTTNTNASELPQRFQQIIDALPAKQKNHTKAAIEPNSNATKTAINVIGSKTASEISQNVSSSVWQHQSKLKLGANANNLANSNNQSKHDSQLQTLKFNKQQIEGKAIQFEANSNSKQTNAAQIAINSNSIRNIGHINSEANVFSQTLISDNQNIAAPINVATEFTANSIQTSLNGQIGRSLSSPQWGAQFSQQVVSMIRPGANGSHIAELRLDPPELGPLRVTINLNDNVIQAVFSSAHASVRNAVEQALPQLQQQLEQEGLSLGQTNVGHEENSSQQGFSEKQNFADFGLKSSNTLDNNQTTANQETTIVRSSNSLVDTFA